MARNGQKSMQFERWQKIERIFGEVVVLPSGDRHDFLAGQCGDDFDLREEIVLMLAEDADEEFLSEPLFNVGARLLDTDDLIQKPEFGSYQLQKLLGRGGMGAVYLARDVRLERLVALKVLPFSVVESETDAARFRQEARAASGVSHPNVAHIYEFGAADDRWFLAMEYVEGKTLRELLNDRHLDEAQILDIIRQTADALAATHRRGIVHRDIKPENIIVADDGAVKILDFGLAKPDTSNDEKPADLPETIYGTVAYMSPEQIRGDTVDSRTDLWSLGVTLFEMLAGKRPFTGETASDVQTAILSQEAVLDDCPKKFRAVAGKLLQKNSANRYQSAADLLIDWRLLKTTDEKNAASRFTAEIKKHKIGIIALLIIIFALTAAGFQIFNKYPPNLLESAPINSIAVLPFANENGDNDNDYLSDGLTEVLINKLSRLSKLSVSPKNAVFRYKNKAPDPQTVGRELSVETVLLGHVALLDDALVINLDLMDTKTGNQIWHKQYHRKNTDLVILQSEIGRDVSANLHSRLSGADEQILGKNYTENPEAYRLYLKGRFYWNKRTGKDLTKSIEYYEQAVALDPNFALAFAGLADTYLLMSGYAAASPHDSFPKAKAAAQKALELDGTLAEAHNALSYALFNYEWNTAEAEKEIKLAIDLNPNYATTHQWYGNAILLATGRFNEAIAESKRAQELDPLSLIINADLGTAYLFARRNDEAVEQLQKTIEMDENFAYAHTYLGRAYLMQNNFPAAIAECQKALSLSEDPRPLVILARIYAKLGKKEKSLRLLDQLKNTARQKYVSPYYFALIYAGLGDNDQAFEQLEKAFQSREGRMTLLNVDPLMDELRADYRLGNLIRRVGISSER